MGTVYEKANYQTNSTTETRQNKEGNRKEFRC